MVTGFLVYGGIVPGPVTDAYMDARESLLGYPQSPPQLEIASTTSGGGPATQLRNAAPGLVETEQEAQQMLEEMQRQFPKYPWVIQQVNYDDASGIDWGR